MCMRRIGYGFERREKDFSHANCDVVFIDGKSDGRVHRHAAFAAAFKGDVIVLIAPGDLGRGQEVTLAKRRAADIGVEIEVCEPEPDKGGRPQGIVLSDKHFDEAKADWTGSMYQTGYICELVAKRAGLPVTPENIEKARLWLYRRFGKRS